MMEKKEKEDEQEKREGKKERDLVPAVEGLEDVIKITSMQDQTGSAAGLDVESSNLTQTTPTQAEVMSTFKDLPDKLGFYF